MMATPWIFLVLVFARVHALPEGMLQQTRADACPAPDFAFCDFVVCENGQCKPDKNSTECFKCECDAGFTGTLCEMPITTPLGCNPGCLNGGICHQTGPSTFACVCPPEFSGNQCEMSAMASHPCLTMPTVVCQNGGTCAVMGAGFLCNCAPGWNGTNCEIAEAVTQCNPNPCGAHGSCIAVNATGGPLAFCSCENRWSGRFCDYNLDGPCVPGYCQSGGTCTPLNNLPICQCPPTHTGQRCETTLPTMGTTMTTWTTSTAPAITPTMTTTTTTTRPTLVLLPGDCSTSPCQNGAQCFTVGNQFACVCAAQWSGPTCTMFDFTTVTSTSTTTTSTSTTTTTRPTLVLLPGDCSTSPCQNGAQCFTIGNQFACVCAAQWSGPTCTMLDSTTVTSTSTTTTTSTTLAPGTDACTPNPCSNGGSCYKHAGSFVCTCTSAFTGPTCALPKTTTTPPVTTGAPVVNCASKPCRNGGTCFDTGNSYFCHCGSSTNFTGRQCETPVSMLATDCPLNCTPGYCVRTGSSAQNNAYACMCNGVLTPTSCS